MTNRFALLLDRLARVLLAGAVVAPVLFGLAQVIPSRPDVQWAISVSRFGGPETGVPYSERADAPWGFSLVLLNSGNATGEDVRIVLGSPVPEAPERPSHVEVSGRPPTGYELIPTDTGLILNLGTLEPGEGHEVTLYRFTSPFIEAVLHGDVPVARTPRPPFFDPRPRLPRWALLAGLFLLAGLAVQVLAMWSRTAGRRPT